MVKVFLVDDEIAAREALRDGVPWAELGLELAGESADGELALAQLREARPDVLITDIRMPFMDGMELCRRVRRELPDTRIVIVSACADFDCAREALALGVRAFLPKPADPAQLAGLLARLAAELREERRRREREDELRRQLNASGRDCRERLLEELYGGADAEAVLRSARALRLNLSARRYLVLLLRAEEGAERERLAVHGALEALSASSGGTALLRRDGAEFSFLVLGDGAKHLHTRAGALAEAAVREAERAAGVKLAFAFGADADRLSGAPDSLRSARAQLNLRDWSGAEPRGGAGASDRADERDLLRFLEREPAPLAELLRGAAPRDVDAIVAERAEALGATRSTALACYLYVDSLLTAARIAGPQGFALGEDARGVLRVHSSSRALLTLSADELRRALERRAAQGSTRYGAVVRKARAYIDEHCTDSGLSLKEVAAQVALSANHFCTVFSREMGVTFGEYLTGLRIARAKELLRDTNLRTGEIADRVGYNDPHYFSNLFKKRTGVSPRDFRRKESAKEDKI